MTQNIVSGTQQSMNRKISNNIEVRSALTTLPDVYHTSHSAQSAITYLVRCKQEDLRREQ